MLLSYKDEPHLSSLQELRGEAEASSLLRRQVAEPVIESSSLGLLYSFPAGSELLRVNQAESLAQWKVTGWPQWDLIHI